MPISTTLAAASLGWAAGMRSMTPPAAVASILAARIVAPRTQPATALASDRTAGLLKLAAAGELVGDKLPVTPARTDAFPLVGRLGSGALVGAAVAAARRESVWPAVIVGALAAGASSFAMMRVRGALAHALGTDWPVALAEDALALTLATQTAHTALD